MTDRKQLKVKSPDEFMDILEQGLGEGGTLTLGIFCTECNTQYELGREGAAMAIMMGATFLEYLRYVQSSQCKKCQKEKDE